MGFLTAIGTWLLKIILGGIFNKVMAKIEMQAQQREEAAKLHAESTIESTGVEVAVVKKQAEVKDEIEEAPDRPDDPFNVDAWNKGNVP